MSNIFKTRGSITITTLFLCIVVIPFIFTSCSNTEGQKTMLDFLPDELDSFNDFFKAWLIVTITQCFTVFFISLYFHCRNRVPNFIIGVVYFIVILINKDYGFWMTILLFFTTTFVGWISSFVFAAIIKLIGLLINRIKRK
jgi:hypothetical protein